MMMVVVLELTEKIKTVEEVSEMDGGVYNSSKGYC